MRATVASVKFELLNDEAMKNIQFESGVKKDFSDLSRLKTQGKEELPFMTFELNQGILDGSLRNFNQDEQKTTAFMSRYTSGGDCGFDTNVWVQTKLDNKYKFIGLTLNLGINYPKKITVEYYHDSQKILYKTIDNIKNSIIFVDMRAADVDSVKIIFDESYAPFQYATLQEILFGDILKWTGEDIISGNLQEETDIISKIVPNDTLSITIYSKTDDFNSLNPRGAYGYLLTNQRFSVEEYIYEIHDRTGQISDTKKLNLGNFYLDSWESLYNKQIKFNLVSPLALLDKTQFKKSRMYSGEEKDNAYGVLEEIFKDCDYGDYYIDESLKTVYLNGYIPVCTHKEAIQQVAFVCNCLVYDNRASPITIKPFDISLNQSIQTTNIFDPIKIEKRESVTGLIINVHNFALKSVPEEIFKGKLPKGVQEIIFNTPCENIQKDSENITIKESGINYAVLDVKEDGEYVLTGEKYEDKSYKYTKEVIDGTSVKKNTLDIDKALLIGPGNVEDIAQKLISFYKLYNLTIEFKFISDGQTTGENVVFTDNENRTFSGAFIRQNIDLGGGFLSNCYLIGYQQIEEPDHLYAGADGMQNQSTELFGGEMCGII